MHVSKLFLALWAGLLLCFSSCEKPESSSTSFDNDAWVLNEGSWGLNNASLSALSCAKGSITQNHAFMSANGRGLGDVAQDMLMTADNRLCIAVSESNSVEVVDGQTGKSIKRIDMGNRYPRYLACDGRNLYVTCYTPRSVVRIDLERLEITGTCLLEGYKQPEQLCYLDGKLYVVSSWESDEQGAFLYDNRLAVVDVASFTLCNSIQTGCNPSRVKPLNDHSIVVSYAGNYNDLPAGTEIIDIHTLQHTSLDVALTNFDCDNGSMVGYSTSYDANWNTTFDFYALWNNSSTLQPILPDFHPQNAYGIWLDPSGDGSMVYVCDAPYNGNGWVSCYNILTGERDWSASAEVLPSKIVWIRFPSDPE